MSLFGNTFDIVRDSVDPNLIDIFVNGNPIPFQQVANTIQQINLTGLAGNDSLTVDSSFGLINNMTTPMPAGTPLATIPINFAASTNGYNQLILTSTAATPLDLIHEPGALPGSVTDLVIDPSQPVRAQTEMVHSTNLAPVIAEFASIATGTIGIEPPAIGALRPERFERDQRRTRSFCRNCEGDR